MIEPKKEEIAEIAFRDASVGGSPLKEAFEKAKDATEKKPKEPTILIECNFIVEVAQSVATKGEHANYVERFVRGMLTENKKVKEIIDVDAFEPEESR
jgi:hypothetical protein